MEVRGRKFIYKCNYKDNKALRNSFNKLTRKTFGFDFEKWYEEGYCYDR